MYKGNTYAVVNFIIVIVKADIKCIEADRVNTDVFNLHQIKQRNFFETPRSSLASSPSIFYHIYLNFLSVHVVNSLIQLAVTLFIAKKMPSKGMGQLFHILYL